MKIVQSLKLPTVGAQYTQKWKTTLLENLQKGTKPKLCQNKLFKLYNAQNGSYLPFQIRFKGFCLI